MRDRPRKLKGTTTKVVLSCGSLYLTLNEDDTGRPLEVFATLGKQGSCKRALLDAVARLVSNMLQMGVSPEDISKILKFTRCDVDVVDKAYAHSVGGILSCIDIIGRVLDGTFRPS